MSWQRHHPADIPRSEWLNWLSGVAEPSPYLLPEWGVFWERVWPHGRAEVWIKKNAAGECEAALPLVRRRRLGLEMCYAQPMGTPSGPIIAPGTNQDDLDVNGAWHAIIGARTVEFVPSPDWMGVSVDGWTRREVVSTAWMLDLPEPHGDDLPMRFSESHRRNIAHGRECYSTITEVRSAEDVASILSLWKAPVRPSRLVLNSYRARTLVDLFAPTGALRWRAAWTAGRPVAVVLFLVNRTQAVYIDGAFDRDRGVRGVGHCLFADTLTQLARDGVRAVDLGGGPGGGRHGGLDRFKAGWGARPISRMSAIYRRPLYHALRSVGRSFRMA